MSEKHVGKTCIIFPGKWSNCLYFNQILFSTSLEILDRRNNQKTPPQFVRSILYAFESAGALSVISIDGFPIFFITPKKIIYLIEKAKYSEIGRKWMQKWNKFGLCLVQIWFKFADLHPHKVFCQKLMGSWNHLLKIDRFLGTQEPRNPCWRGPWVGTKTWIEKAGTNMQFTCWQRLTVLLPSPL